MLLLFLKYSSLILLPFLFLFPFTISLFQKYQAQMQSLVHSWLPKNAHLSQVCLSSTITFYITVFCIVWLSCPLKALEWGTQKHQYHRIDSKFVRSIIYSSSRNSRGKPIGDSIECICRRVQMCMCAWYTHACSCTCIHTHTHLHMT